MEYEKIHEVIKKIVDDISPVEESNYNEKILEDLTTERVFVEMLLEYIKDICRLSHKLELYKNVIRKDAKKLQCRRDGEQALKRGLKIGVATKYKDSAERFMINNFNVPDRKKYSNNSIIYEYRNGDTVEWIAPIEYNRGKRVDKMYIQSSLGTGIIDGMLRNSSIPNPEYIDID